jgi:hypothetical protein
MNPYDVTFLRRKTARSDAYAEQLANQNQGERCEHCNSLSGHYRHCPLINREAAEAKSILTNPSEADKIAAHGLGVVL